VRQDATAATEQPTGGSSAVTVVDTSATPCGRRYLKLAHGYTAAHPDGIVSYTAHELRHVCASLLIASGATRPEEGDHYGVSHAEVERVAVVLAHLHGALTPPCSIVRIAS
jgi:hypothetical protein